MKIRSAKNKGYRLQRSVAEEIQSVFNLEPRDVVSTPSSCIGVDILLSSRARDVFPFSVECKNTEHINIWKAWEQAESNTVGTTRPMVVFSKNRSKRLCCLEFNTLLYILSNRRINNDTNTDTD